ncbi:antithrombin-III [Corythoichthys intestinalis]|uniref:antithrombin-III n=1 Tax=Corythoichthys intestinalis TaxID=161448 RepID=UPI0025A52B7D|nr:antithrombin-III [Corythoichthys intestinalis]XP_061790565.1 antithrombin-III-like [Nerophis lumbriciformis]
MGASDWLFLLGVLSVACGSAPDDPCTIKAKDVVLEPRCVYRVPEDDAPDNSTDGSVPPSTNPRVWELSAANARFALALYRQVALGRDPDANLFLSPLSVSAAFSMTKLGACGRTLEEIMKVFEFDSVTERTSDKVHFYFAKLLCRLYRKIDSSTQLAVANRLFGDRSLRFNATYQNISRQVYGAEMMSLDFRAQPEASRAAINAWVANKTENNIRDALPAGAVNADAVLVLVNTIYFKGSWQKRFREDDAYEAPFRVDAWRSCSVTMMFQESTFRYARLPAEHLQLLEMEYRGRDTAMTLLLPDRGHLLAQVETELNLPTLTRWLERMTETRVSVNLPRFRLEESLRLKEALNAMGLRDVFSPENASLPGLLADDADGVFISDAYHKAFLEVNELGSEASASTGAVAAGRSIKLDAEVFAADRPFLLLIREKTLNAVVFVGRVARPC